MNQEIIDFWQRNNTPIGLMVQNAPKHGVTAKQVERAAQIVYEEAQEIIENVPELKPYMGFYTFNGKKRERTLVTSKSYEKTWLFRNQLKKNMLGWRVFIVAKSVKAKAYDSELVTARKQIRVLEDKLEKKGLWYRLKNMNWRIPPWQ